MKKITFALSGNIGRDAEVKETKSEYKAITFSIAVNEQVKVGDKYEKSTEFYNLTMFRKNPTKLVELLKKGTKIAVEGDVRQNAVKGQDGKTQTYYDFVVNDIDFLSAGAKSEAAPAAAPVAESDEIPF